MARLYRVSFLEGRPASRGVVVKLPMSSAEACLTRTLIGIVAMSLVLVTPSELVNLNFYAAGPTDGQRLGVAIVVTNALQTANFSFNFVLYLVVNAQFRAAVAETCRCPGTPSPCCRKPPTAATTELIELGCPLTVATAAGAGGETATVSASPHEDHVFRTVAVEVSHVYQTVSRHHRHYDDDDNNDDNDGEQPVDQCYC